MTPLQMLAPAYQVSVHDHSQVIANQIHIYFLSLRLWRDALYRTAVEMAVPCSLRTAKEGRQNSLRDDDFHSGLRPLPAGGSGSV